MLSTVEDLIDDDEIVDDDPASLEYTAAVTEIQTVRCSQWQRACISHATEVVLSHYGLGKRGAEALARSLAKHVHICTLDLSDNGLGGEGVTSVLTALQQRNAAPSLRFMSLRQNQAGQEGAEAVAEFLRSNHPLASLDLSSNALCSKGAGTISDGLLSNSTVTSLSLESNDIDSEGVEHLAKALATNRSLTSLSLEWNSISKEGAQALSELLIDDSLALAALNLGWNGLGDAGATLLSNAITVRPSEGALRDVRLHHNRLSAEAAVPLSRALSGLDVLDVSGNALGASGAAVLLLAQQELQVAADEKENADGAGVRRCQLKMEDVCVRPDTSLAGLVMRAAAGDAIPIGEMEASGVQAAAAIALRSAKPPPKPPKAKKGGKQPAPGEEPWVRDPNAAAPSASKPAGKVKDVQPSAKGKKKR